MGLASEEWEFNQGRGLQSARSAQIRAFAGCNSEETSLAPEVQPNSRECA